MNTVFEKARAFMYRNARPLELARFQYHFENGTQEAVLHALSFYQNEDGGFGHALEPDSWDPHSTPYTTLKAAQLMNGIGFNDYSHPLYQGALRYLRSGDGFTPQGGWQFSMPTGNDHPHAPWWTYSEESNGVENLGLSAQIAAFVLDACPPDDPLHHKAEAIARRALDSLMNGETRGEMGVSGCAMLMPHWLQMDTPYTTDTVGQKMKQTAKASIVLDPARWNTHVPRPSSVIPSPDAPMYPGNEDAIRLELDWLIDTLPENDLWPIDWSWFDNNARYPNEFAISEMWWKAWCGIDKLLLLRRFDRLS